MILTVAADWWGHLKCISSEAPDDQRAFASIPD